MHHDIDPHAAAYALGVELHTLRNWRRDGLHDYGVKWGKSNFYNASELARLAVAAFVAHYGIHLREAFAVVSARKFQIDSEVERIKAGKSARRDYVLTLSLDPYRSAGYSAVTGAAPDKIAFDRVVPGLLAVNVTEIIRSALSRAETHMRSAGVQADEDE